MSKRTILVVTIFAGLLTIALPIAISLHLADKAALDRGREYVLTFADEVITRSDLAASQAIHARDVMQSLPSTQPCDELHVTMMRRLAFSSNYLKAVGHVEQGRLLCSSIGGALGDFNLGPVDVYQPNGVTIRSNVEFSFLPNERFFALEQNGFVAIVQKEMPLDISRHRSELSVAVLSKIGDKPLSAQGYIDPKWIKKMWEGQRMTFLDHGYLVAVVPSQTNWIGAVAALPLSEINSYALARVIVPLGVVASALLTMLLVYLARQQLSVPSAIKSGLRRNEFHLEYQPVVELTTGRWVGAEALMRWTRQDGERVRPDLFIQVAEDSGLIGRITARLVQLLKRDWVVLLPSERKFHISINVSAADLRNKELPALLHSMCQGMGQAPCRFIVEITERCFQDPEATRQAVQALREKGIEVAIDDFGTGYSSLSSLEHFELDYLKIDKTFVDTIGVETATSHVIFHIIEMAKALNLQMIAEGVETEEQAEFLRNHGVQYAQGWLFSKPLPLPVLLKKLEI